MRARRLRETGEHGRDLLVAADVAVEDELRVEFGCKFGDPVLESIADIAEGEFRALAVARARHSVGDGSIVQDARDEQSFAGEESHAVSGC